MEYLISKNEEIFKKFSDDPCNDFLMADFTLSFKK